jgi:hypothetical protein
VHVSLAPLTDQETRELSGIFQRVEKVLRSSAGGRAAWDALFLRRSLTGSSTWHPDIAENSGKPARPAEGAALPSLCSTCSSPVEQPLSGERCPAARGHLFVGGLVGGVEAMGRPRPEMLGASSRGFGCAAQFGFPGRY